MALRLALVRVREDGKSAPEILFDVNLQAALEDALLSVEGRVFRKRGLGVRAAQEAAVALATVEQTLRRQASTL